MAEKNYSVEKPAGSSKNDTAVNARNNAGSNKSENNTGGNKTRDDAGSKITGRAENNASNGYIGGDRTRSSSSHQFHKDNIQESRRND
jgi:hypothetical protein